MRYIFPVFFVVSFLQGFSQAKLYSTANAHAHNDYENDHPFWGAYKSGFGSIEADVFLHNGQLVVAHDSAQLSRLWTLDSLYLRPIEQCLQANGGSIYPDSTKSLQVMVDIKSEAGPTLQILVQAIKAFPSLRGAKTLKFVISGNRPLPSAFPSYPCWILFDGEMQKSYTPEEWKRIEMVSGNFKKISGWNGKGRMVEKERTALKNLVAATHARGKKIRFWNTPDNLNTWYTFLDEGVDYLNTDRIPA
ncbi:MAG: alkaline phosphatase, partial [Chitinophagaceae bacterium]